MIPLNFISSFLCSVPAKEVAGMAVHTDPAATESYYKIARVLMDLVRTFLGWFGAEHNQTLFIWLYAILVVAVAAAVGELLKWIVVAVLRGLSPRVKSNFYKYLVQNHFFIKACRIIPPILFLILIQFTFNFHDHILLWGTKISWIMIACCLAQTLCSLSDVIWQSVNERENKRHLPLRGILEVVKLTIWIICIIVIVALLVNKSPGALLAGLGAFAAVLMLIFKDSILGIVAGVQLAENDSLHVGDWISIPNSEANGIVDNVSLTEVKIINWDKTVSTVPPYALISGGFKNFRNMQESGTRRIQRSYMIDADSVVETTPEMLDEFSKIPLMKDWIDKKRAQKEAGKVEDVSNSEGLADGTIDTNLGMFRAYVLMYLQQNPNIDKNSFCFVTTLAQTAYGIPLQIYCFTTTSAWVAYEGIQAALFEHLAVMLYKFKLYVYESASGRDTLIDGFMSPGKNPASVLGIPYPFFNGSGTPMNPGIPPEGVYQK